MIGIEQTCLFRQMEGPALIITPDGRRWMPGKGIRARAGAGGSSYAPSEPHGEEEGVCPVSPMVKENIGDRVLKRLEQEKVMPSGV